MARKPDPKKGLGRGLSALLGDEAPGPDPAGTVARTAPADRLPIDRIHPNPGQPRRNFDEADLEDLARSVAERGVIQPIIVRPHPSREGAYEIVAGERRWRAAGRAQLHDIPVVIRDLDDRAVLEIAVIENVQRADLNPIEEAAGYASLIEQFGYTQEALAQVVGKSRSHLANMMRLLGLPEAIQAHVREGRLTAGHARALAAAEDPAALARDAIAKGWSVRQVEDAARKGADPRKRGGGGGGGRGGGPEKDADTRLLEGDLAAQIGMKVDIRHLDDRGGGEVRITYRSLEELDLLCRKLAE